MSLAGLLLLVMSGMAWSYLAETEVVVRAATIDLDVREDEPGVQYAASTLKNIPLRVGIVSASLDTSLRVDATLAGPGLEEPLLISASLGGALELPPLPIAGLYHIEDVKIVAEGGGVVAERDPRPRHALGLVLGLHVPKHVGDVLLLQLLVAVVDAQLLE